jgi:O-acetyl-ADP-ribose deacetylase (regulator of RNase III)
VIRVVVDDLAAMSADAIVRPATIRLAAATPAAERVGQAGGPAFAEAIVLRRDLAVGAAVVTAGGALPAEFVIHAVVAAADGAVTRLGLSRAWLSALERAQEWQFAHVAAPPIARVSPELPLDDLADEMLLVLAGHRAAGGFPHALSFVVATEDEHGVFRAAIRRHHLESP